MKLISFLGGQEGGAGVYTCAGTSCETRFVQEAICRLLGTVDTAVIFAPEGDRNAAWEPVSAALVGCGVHPELEIIPDGETEDELWEIFRALENSIDDGEKIVFDITHGFRSLLLVGFLSAAFLRTTGKAEISHVFYSPDRGEGQPSPLLDLTPFLSILDWTTSVHAFLRSMDGAGINCLANRTAKEAYLSGRLDAPEKLSRFAETLDGFALATRMARPVEALNFASGIARDIDEVTGEMEVFTPPLVEVLDEIRTVGDLGIRKPNPDEGLTWAHVEKELGLIGFMIERGLLLQGVTFSREWMVNVMLLIRYRDGYTEWLNPEIRYEMSQTFGAALLDLKQSPYNPTGLTDWYMQLPWEEQATHLWGELSSIRNDFAHCGMREFPPRITRMDDKAKELYGHLCVFFGMVQR
ncbi:TM1812 family CRISPR-associated protein [Methanogenium sp. S4BF]|uniref:TM1812 family CRISPR-associated protein n=1 Tax=Methanogenium sp. S4BF TaxID=1789226 RepID=UPI00241813A6|nr:TM1812 family CRISPR-associated protein [Methanogenium sp. S4BF]WFN34156.1 TM1812 family CRISPR-associated protein [Methanogenium sp. S4BF]